MPRFHAGIFKMNEDKRAGAANKVLHTTVRINNLDESLKLLRCLRHEVDSTKNCPSGKFTCEEIRKKGAKIVRELGPMKHGGTEVAFIEAIKSN